MLLSRICPGRHFADINMWLLVASILAVFDINPATDPVSGEKLMPDMEFTGFIRWDLKLTLIFISVK